LAKNQLITYQTLDRMKSNNHENKHN